MVLVPFRGNTVLIAFTWEHVKKEEKKFSSPFGVIQFLSI